MFFFIRFAIAVLLICCALGWRTGGSSSPGGARPQAKAPSQSANRAAIDRTVAAGLAAARVGADALAQAAQEKCVSAPADCLEIARRIRAMERR